MALLRLAGRRLALAGPGLLGVIVVTFLLNRALPGDPAAFFAGPAATRQAIEEIRARLGLDKSVPEQFVYYVRDLARGDLGTSLTTGQPVLRDLATRLPASLELTLAGLALAVTVALPLGVLSATRPGSWVDHLARVVTTAGVSLPIFFTGLLLVYVFYFLLGWAPAPLGRLDAFSTAPRQVTGFFVVDAVLAHDGALAWAALRQLALPAVTLGLFAMAPIARMTRASMLGVLGSEFIRTARAAGLAPRTVLVTYALRNALLRCHRAPRTSASRPRRATASGPTRSAATSWAACWWPRAWTSLSRSRRSPCRSWWAACSARRPGSSAAGRTASSRASPTPSWPSRCSSSPWPSWPRSATRSPTSCTRRPSSTCRSTRAWRGPRSTCGVKPASWRRRGSQATAPRASSPSTCSPTACPR